MRTKMLINIFFPLPLVVEALPRWARRNNRRLMIDAAILGAVVWVWARVDRRAKGGERGKGTRYSEDPWSEGIETKGV